LPWLSIPLRLELTRTHLVLAETDQAATLLDELDVLLKTTAGFTVSEDETRELRAGVDALARPRGGWLASITPAERNLIPLLATHLTFREIADELRVSRNTVKTQAVSVYRKLQVSSRSEAIGAAAESGLLPSRPPSRRRG
jgi:LuxR family maltose regulon positive regulatory protein